MSLSVILNKANTCFCLDLLKTMSQEERTANLFVSPFSISAALAMVMMGARGDTAAQLSQVLGFTEETEQVTGGVPLISRRRWRQTQPSSRLPDVLLKVIACFPQCRNPQTENDDDQDDIHSKFADLLRDVHRDPALVIANRLYGDRACVFVKKFLEGTKEFYNAELQALDFRNNAEDARLSINSWVEQQTKGQIMDLLVEGVVNSLTRLVLVNAIYFKGTWTRSFDVADTTEEQFRLNKNDTKPVKMMHVKSKFNTNVVPELNCKILEMPYEGEHLSMIIILPNDIEDETTGLEKLERELTFDRFVEWTRPDMMGRNEVEVKLPRFKMEETYDLKDVLTSMGVVDAFDDARSDFSGMSPSNGLVLSKVVHKAFVEVNEEGTEAAAASVGVVSIRGEFVPTTFFADHPFIFFIQHKPTKTVLFAGRCCSPQST